MTSFAHIRMRSTLVVMVACIAWYPGTGLPQVCKWVDEEGVTHFAEKCPEGIEGVVIGIEAPPPRERVEAAEARARQGAESRAARRELEQREKEQAAREKSLRAEESGSREQACVEAFRARQTLSAQGPVYMDEQGRVHPDKSLHHYYYHGERNYLSDPQRQAEMQRVSDLLENCDQTVSAARLVVRTYARPPGMNEIMNLMQYIKHGGLFESKEDLCGYAEYVLDDLRKSKTGIPDTPMRELDEQIGIHCR